VLFDAFDLLGPGASGVVGVGDSGGVLALCLGEVLEEVVEFFLQSGTAHGFRVALWVVVQMSGLVLALCACSAQRRWGPIFADGVRCWPPFKLWLGEDSECRMTIAPR